MALGKYTHLLDEATLKNQLARDITNAGESESWFDYCQDLCQALLGAYHLIDSLSKEMEDLYEENKLWLDTVEELQAELESIDRDELSLTLPSLQHEYLDGETVPPTLVGNSAGSSHEETR